MYGWPCALIQFYMTRKYVNWKISLILGPTSIITALIGAFILVGIQSVWYVGSILHGYKLNIIKSITGLKDVLAY